MYTIVKWERYLNKIIIQCHCCQTWGHTTSNYRMSPKCSKCASNLLTADCKEPANTPAKCANWTHSHSANSVDCEVYKRALGRRAQNPPAPPPQLTPSAGRWPLFPTPEGPPLPPRPLPRLSAILPQPGILPHSTPRPRPDNLLLEQAVQRITQWISLGRWLNLINVSGLVVEIRDLNRLLTDCQTGQD